MSRNYISKYADILEVCIRNNYNANEFIERCEEEDLPVTEHRLHSQLYENLQRLDANNQNGIWARIIKNAFAPLFIGRVDFIAGNPPWVNWENLPDDYRDSMKPLWKEYDLFTLSGSAGKLGGGKKDLSMLFVYSAVDNYLLNGGRLGFVITQSVFKSKGAGDGFRQFCFTRNNKTVVLKPLIIHDLSSIQVFEGATNRTAVFVCEKSEKMFSYPVPYIAWYGPSRIDQDENLKNVFIQTDRHNLGAIPIVRKSLSSPWLTVPKNTLKAINKIFGNNTYRAHAGVYTGGLNGCFWIHLLKELDNGDFLIENLHDVGKKKVDHVQSVIEPDLVYPLLRGRDVSRWHATSSDHIILAQDPIRRRGTPESEMKRKHPKTYTYLKKFEQELQQRASSSIQRLMETGAFYSMFAVGPYTLAPWKVLWRYIASSFTCCVSPLSKWLVMPDHRLILIPFQEENEAYYICGLLNSTPVVFMIDSFVIGTQIAPHVISNLLLPAYHPDNITHNRLAELSKLCHSATLKGNKESLNNFENEIDQEACKIWGITQDELNFIQDAIRDNKDRKKKHTRRKT